MEGFNYEPQPPTEEEIPILFVKSYSSDILTLNNDDFQGDYLALFFAGTDINGENFPKMALLMPIDEAVGNLWYLNESTKRAVREYKERKGSD